MTEQVKKRLTKADAVLIALLLCLTVFLFVRPLLFPAESSGYFTVTSGGVTQTYSLAEERIIELESNGISLILTVADGCVSVTQSDCPDGVCRSTGEISRVGQSIVCIPGQAVIRIGEGGASDEDFIVG